MTNKEKLIYIAKNGMIVSKQFESSYYRTNNKEFWDQSAYWKSISEWARGYVELVQFTNNKNNDENIEGFYQTIKTMIDMKKEQESNEKIIH